jgi:hypothetical protein
MNSSFFNGIQCFDSLKHQDKFQKLRKEFISCREQFTKTGNDSEINLPSYYDCLNNYFSNQSGLPDVSYGDSQVFDTVLNEDYDDETSQRSQMG